jgi:hypothetical protein
MNCFRHVLVIGFIGSVVLLLLATADAGSRSDSTCVLCRLNRIDTRFFGVTRSSYEENDCTRWYHAHVDPAHAHIWERGSCTTLLNGIGIPIGVRCAAGYFPILSLDPSTQLRVYQHFPDPKRAKALFASLTHERADRERRERGVESTGELIVRALNDWDASGFPGSWDDWWDHCSACGRRVTASTRHVRERLRSRGSRNSAAGAQDLHRDRPERYSRPA